MSQILIVMLFERREGRSPTVIWGCSGPVASGVAQVLECLWSSGPWGAAPAPPSTQHSVPSFLKELHTVGSACGAITVSSSLKQHAAHSRRHLGLQHAWQFVCSQAVQSEGLQWSPSSAGAFVHVDACHLCA